MLRFEHALPVLLVATAWPSNANACSCVVVPLSRELIPVTEGFPTDGVLRVVLQGGWPEALRERIAEEYRLRGEDGALVPLRAEVEGTMIALAPRSRLAPRTRYVVERLFAYGDGDLLTDEERWSIARGPGARKLDEAPLKVVRAWFPEVELRTGDGPGDRVPPTPAIATAHYDRRSGGGDCGPGESVSFTLELPADLVAGDVLGVELKGSGVVWRAAYTPWPADADLDPPDARSRRGWVSDMLCAEPKVHVDVTRPVRVRAVAWSASGRASARSSWVIAEPAWEAGREPRVPKPHTGAFALREDEARPAAEAFLATPIIEATPAPGPAACPAGPAPASGPYHVTTHRWIQSGEQLVRAGDRLWLLVQDEEKRDSTVSALQIGPDGPVGSALPLGGRRETYVAVGGEVPFVIAARPDSGGMRLRRPRADGSSIWEHAFPDTGRVMAGDGRLLVLWERERETDTRRERWPAWVVLDAATGEELGRGDLGPLGPATSVETVGWDGSAFAIAWTWSSESARAGSRELPAGTEGTWLARIGADGTVNQTFALPAHPHAIVRTPEGWIVSHRSEVWWLDAAGAVASGPWSVPRAVVPGIGDLAAWGDLAVVAGRAMTGGSAIALLGRDGALSPALAPGDGRPSIDVSVETVGDRVVAAYGVSLAPGAGWFVGVEPLRCGDEAPLGPPARLAR
ncbi:MAG: hypothetical protein ACOZNI_19595 [Myxococcota bacterium]